MRDTLLHTVSRALVLLFAAVMLLSLSGCRPTDFFTEVIISTFADIVDEDNEQRTVVNSPDAEEESSALSTLAWTDESARSEEVENVVVYSSEPNTAQSTRHSVFALDALIPGIEASDGVRIVYDDSSELDEENDGAQEQPQDAETTSVGGEDDESSEQTAQTDEEAQGTSESAEAESDADGQAAAGQGAGGDEGSQAGGDAFDTANEGQGEGSDEGDGTTQDASSGYEGTVSVYNSGDAFSDVPNVESLGVIGSDVAVMVQAIGGQGAICAMSEDAYYGAEDATTASCFADVFSDELPSGFEQSCLLWGDDGSSPDDLADVEALLEALGQGGVIVYDQTLGDQYDFFSQAQREALAAAEVTLVPVEFSTVDGLLDAAAVIGDALAQSETCANDSSAYAQAYRSAVSAIVSAAADAHGGALSAVSYTNFSMLTDYISCPVTGVEVVSGGTYPVQCYIATQAQSGWTWSGDGDVDTTGIVLLGEASYDASPLAFWGQAAGVAPGFGSASGAAAGKQLLWPYFSTASDSTLSGADGIYKAWVAYGCSANAMSTGPDSVSSGLNVNTRCGLGSLYIPYLVVCATDDMSVEDVRELTLESLDAYADDGSVETYSALPYNTSSSGEGSRIPGAALGSNYRSTIGSTNATTSQSPFFDGLDTASVVRCNPVGLLGSWTQGTMESVLETLWLCELYSYEPDGCAFAAINDLDDFSVTLGDVECTTFEEVVGQFYRYFYRVGEDELDDAYDSAVPDQFEDLR